MTGNPITSDLTEGQRKQYLRFVEDAATKALPGVTKEGLQRLIESGGDFQEGLIALVQKHTVTDEFADEKVESSYGYLSGYSTPAPFQAQCDILRSAFGIEIAYHESALTTQLASGAEGNFPLFDWRDIAPTYGEAVVLVFAKLSEQRKGRFYNHRDGQLGSSQLRESTRKVSMIQKLREEQKGSKLLVVQAQFGIRHRGRSVRRARAVMGGSEFGLGAFEVGIMLLTNPNRLQHFDDLWIDAAGDEFAPDADGVFYSAPCFVFYDESLEFNACDIGGPRDSCGSASAFVPPVVVPSE